MLVKIKKLNILNDGYSMKVSLDGMYVNVNHIVSISDYNQVKNFLLQEKTIIKESENFSLLKVLTAGKVEEIIVLGTSEELYSSFNKTTGPRILND